MKYVLTLFLSFQSFEKFFVKLVTKNGLFFFLFGYKCSTFNLDWTHTHKVCKESTYYNGHLDDKNHDNVMNCTYYIVFEQNYKNYQWWQDKKARIEQTRKDYKDPALKAKAEAQTKVTIFIHPR